MKKKVKNPRVKRTRNNETLTESGYWTMISSALRRASRFWKAAQAVKEASRKPYTGPNKIQKWVYQCNHCKKWFKDSEVQADHIIPVGSLKCSADLAGFVDRLFVEKEGWQILCKPCHDIKTAEDIKKIRGK